MIIWHLSGSACDGYTLIFFIQKCWISVFRVVVITAIIIFNDLFQTLSDIGYDVSGTNARPAQAHNKQCLTLLVLASDLELLEFLSSLDTLHVWLEPRARESESLQWCLICSRQLPHDLLMGLSDCWLMNLLSSNADCCRQLICAQSCAQLDDPNIELRYLFSDWYWSILSASRSSSSFIKSCLYRPRFE